MPDERISPKVIFWSGAAMAPMIPPIWPDGKPLGMVAQ
jgi:hypothetical protein